MRYIGRADAEFYESTMVLTTARTLTDRDWETLSYRSRQRLLNRAVSIVCALLNSNEVMRKMELRLRFNPPDQRNT